MLDLRRFWTVLTLMCMDGITDAAYAHQENGLSRQRSGASIRLSWTWLAGRRPPAAGHRAAPTDPASRGTMHR
jgi:hypothetical protein